MSWKLSTLAIALAGMFASSLAAAGQGTPRKDAGPQHNAPAVASGDTRPVAPAKQTDKYLKKLDEQNKKK